MDSRNFAAFNKGFPVSQIIFKRWWIWETITIQASKIRLVSDAFASLFVYLFIYLFIT